MKALWEGLVLNVVHCEVETRDSYMKSDSASSSSAPIRLSDECTWGGDSAHWIALRELGRLAMLSNTSPGAGENFTNVITGSLTFCVFALRLGSETCHPGKKIRFPVNIVCLP